MKQAWLKVLANEAISPGHWVMSLECPSWLKKAQPGQFIQILLDEGTEPLLPRPFSFLDITPSEVRILYQVVGKGTRLLALKKKGDKLIVTGPLGRGFEWVTGKEAILVGGGVGIPPLFHLAKFRRAKSKASKIHVFLGGRNRKLLHCEKDFKKLGLDVRVSTDDGSKGTRGVITAPLREFLGAHVEAKNLVVYACGPTPMLKAVSILAAEFGIPCQVSVEECMPCGFGACLGCAIKVRKDDGFRYAISCTEGPVFNAREILWE